MSVSDTKQTLMDAFSEVDPNKTGFSCTRIALTLVGKVSIGELRYVLTGVNGFHLTDEEVDEIVKDVQIDSEHNLNYVELLQQTLG